MFMLHTLFKIKMFNFRIKGSEYEKTYYDECCHTWAFKLSESQCG